MDVGYVWDAIRSLNALIKGKHMLTTCLLHEKAVLVLVNEPTDMNASPN